MDLFLHFILVNSEFNQAIADDLDDGQETEDNIKHLWEDELKVASSVNEFRIRNNAVYKLEGYYPDNTLFSFEIENMSVVDCTTIDSTLSQFAVSKKLIKKTDKTVDEEKKETHLYFYLKDGIPMENPMDGIYIAQSDYPKQLKKF